jgi:hypothetical protein
MKNRIMLFLAAFALASGVAHAATNSTAKVGKQQGGDRFYVASGGELDVESGGALKINGTQVTSTAAELNQVAVASQSTSGISTLKVARFTWDCGSGSGCPIGATALDAALPAKAVIIRSWLRVTTQFADTGTCTIAISCEDANNIKTATDITGSAAGAFIEGQSTGAASAFIASIAAACTITGTVADGGSCVPTAGKLTGWVMYVTHD